MPPPPPDAVFRCFDDVAGIDFYFFDVISLRLFLMCCRPLSFFSLSSLSLFFISIISIITPPISAALRDVHFFADTGLLSRLRSRRLTFSIDFEMMYVWFFGRCWNTLLEDDFPEIRYFDGRFSRPITIAAKYRGRRWCKWGLRWWGRHFDKWHYAMTLRDADDDVMSRRLMRTFHYADLGPP